VGLTRNPSKLVVPKGSGGEDAKKPLYDHLNLSHRRAEGRLRCTIDGIEGITFAISDTPESHYHSQTNSANFCGSVPFENAAGDEVNTSADVQFRTI
jgi:hypothetical protein